MLTPKNNPIKMKGGWVFLYSDGTHSKAFSERAQALREGQAYQSSLKLKQEALVKKEAEKSSEKTEADSTDGKSSESQGEDGTSPSKDSKKGKKKNK